MKAGAFKKPATSTKGGAPAPASNDKGQDAAEDLARLIVEALPDATSEKISCHPRFKFPAFGELLNKALTESFGVPSSGGAA